MQGYQPDRRFTGYIMHELSLAMSVREIVEDAAEKNGSKKINEVNIIVGEFSSVSTDALEFALDVVKKGSLFENARININSTKTVLSCSECSGETIMEDYVFKCGLCASTSVKIISGDRMYVDSIDIDLEK